MLLNIYEFGKIALDFSEILGDICKTKQKIWRI